MVLSCVCTTRFDTNRPIFPTESTNIEETSKMRWRQRKLRLEQWRRKVGDGGRWRTEPLGKLARWEDGFDIGEDRDSRDDEILIAQALGSARLDCSRWSHTIGRRPCSRCYRARQLDVAIDTFLPSKTIALKTMTFGGTCNRAALRWREGRGMQAGRGGRGMQAKRGRGRDREDVGDRDEQMTLILPTNFEQRI